MQIKQPSQFGSSQKKKSQKSHFHLANNQNTEHFFTPWQYEVDEPILINQLISQNSQIIQQNLELHSKRTAKQSTSICDDERQTYLKKYMNQKFKNKVLKAMIEEEISTSKNTIEVEKNYQQSKKYSLPAIHPSNNGQLQKLFKHQNYQKQNQIAMNLFGLKQQQQLKKSMFLKYEETERKNSKKHGLNANNMNDGNEYKYGLNESLPPLPSQFSKQQHKGLGSMSLKPLLYKHSNDKLQHEISYRQMKSIDNQLGHDGINRSNRKSKKEQESNKKLIMKGEKFIVEKNYHTLSLRRNQEDSYYQSTRALRKSNITPHSQLFGHKKEHIIQKVLQQLKHKIQL